MSKPKAPDPSDRIAPSPPSTDRKNTRKLAMTRQELVGILKRVCYLPHPEVRTGGVNLHNDIFGTIDREVNVVISRGASLDITGDISIGPWTMIGNRTVIYTHDHYHEGREPLLRVQEEKGVKWQNKVIGKDVWLHGCTILCQVTHIPDGVVVGANAVLTKNPGPYEIWAGNPARKVGER